MKLSIQELADAFNELVDSESHQYQTSDKRVSKHISVRRIQSYVTHGLLDKPIKEGNRAYYTESHLNQLSQLRLYAATGLSDNALKKIEGNLNYGRSPDTQQVDPDEELRLSALSAIHDIQGFNSSTTTNSNHTESLLHTIGRSFTNRTTRRWQEIQLNDEGSVFLKIDLDTALSRQQKQDVLKNIAQLLHIEDKNAEN